VACGLALDAIIVAMAWRIEKQSDGRFAIYSTRLRDYIVIDADAATIEEIYKEKGVAVYLASARAQMAKDQRVSEEGESLIEASRRRGATPKEPPEPIGATGFTRE
jgi:hypothetical protein